MVGRKVSEGRWIGRYRVFLFETLQKYFRFPDNRTEIEKALLGVVETRG